jgi:hypothetical protein
VAASATISPWLVGVPPNATFHEPRGDQATRVLVGMDLTPLVNDESLDVIEFTRSHIRRFENEVVSNLANAEVSKLVAKS